MTSNALVCKIESNFVQFEVEQIPIDESKTENYRSYPVEIIECDLLTIRPTIESFDEGELLIVEHDGKKIIDIISKNTEETKRRCDFRRCMRNG